ncbi:MAG TPA: MotA/TolQ/ExbB proton channel family protein [Candidatus Hydrogenedens sp.]|nr:MotA/TolQ/ExbB proton channel family protein [Candidatus Hydrogenedens sp.]HPP58806.1 MotA/TolQ/ExbB proton channel family protein [Candidatus Hydrogenedens sp.]
MRNKWILFLLLLVVFYVFNYCYGQDASTASAVPQIQQNLTLWDMIKAGGVILWVIGVLGFIGLVWALYLLLTLTPRRELPQTLIRRLFHLLQAGDYKGVLDLCEGRDELIAKMVFAGVKLVGHDRYVVQDAMESEGERGASLLWQRISYLNNIAVLAPLLGLLGTVWGMMQAFGAIAFNDAQVKGLTMAYSVATAMVTTAGGLVVAIPAMAIYFYLRGRVNRIIAEVEAVASELVELIAKGARL